MIFDTSQRQRIASGLRPYVGSLDIEQLVEKHGSPFFLLDAAIIRQRYQQLQQALPGVRHYYAMKALSHRAVLRAIKDCDGYLDVATPGEIAIAQSVGFSMERIFHTHPVKKPSEIASAIKAGIKRFVVDNSDELAKFEAYGHSVELMVRLSHRDPDASLDLSYKFGADQQLATSLVSQAIQQGNVVVGFCIHIGSQIHNPGAYADALQQTIDLVDELESTQNLHITHIDIGGGFPVEYRQEVASIAHIAESVMPIITANANRFEFSAEPGRYVAAPAMLAISSVVGKARRNDTQWYYIDDGVYGAYANNIFEGIIPHMFSLKELYGMPTGPAESVVVAGPTCDSIDVILESYPLPSMGIGDILLSPMMGAYSSVLATTFNSIPLTNIVVIGVQPDGLPTFDTDKKPAYS